MSTLKAFREAGTLYRRAGDVAAYGNCLLEQALCHDPVDNPAGSWAKARQLYRMAESVLRETDEHRNRALAMHGLAWSTMPANDPRGSWAEAAVLFREAAVLWGVAGSESDQARAFFRPGERLSPENSPEGSWDAALTAFQDSERAARAANDDRKLANALREQERCLEHTQSSNGGSGSSR